MMETKQISSQFNQLESTQIFPADYDYKILDDDFIVDESNRDSLQDTVTVNSDSASLEDLATYQTQIKELWSQIGELFSNGQLDKDHPLIHELVQMLQFRRLIHQPLLLTSLKTLETVLDQLQPRTVQLVQV